MKLHEKQQFKVIIEQDEDGFFVALVPALPGCYTQATNFQDLIVRTREAISLCLEVAESDSEYRTAIKEFSYEPNFIGLQTLEA